MKKVIQPKIYLYSQPKDGNYAKFFLDNLPIVAHSPLCLPISRTESVIKQCKKIREKCLFDINIIVILLGQDTWRSAELDWLINSGLNSKNKTKSAILGICLPTRDDFGKGRYSKSTIPPRLHDNVRSNYAEIRDFREEPVLIKKWINDIIKNKKGTSKNHRKPIYKDLNGNGW
ncbi:MAG: TIR domain-containing protein [Bacteroidota bacterium]